MLVGFGYDLCEVMISMYNRWLVFISVAVCSTANGAISLVAKFHLKEQTWMMFAPVFKALSLLILAQFAVAGGLQIGEYHWAHFWFFN